MPDARARYRKASMAREVLSGGLLPVPARVVSPSTRPRTTRPRRVSDVCDSLDHLVRANQDRLRNRDAEGLRRLHVDHQLELRRLLDRNISRPGTLEDPVYKVG